MSVEEDNKTRQQRVDSIDLLVKTVTSDVSLVCVFYLLLILLLLSSDDGGIRPSS